MKRARELLISNELDFAAEISLVVIDNNLDNFDAVALYTSIDTAIKERDAKLKAEEERRQIEEMRVMANNAKEQKNFFFRHFFLMPKRYLHHTSVRRPTKPPQRSNTTHRHCLQT